MKKLLPVKKHKPGLWVVPLKAEYSGQNMIVTFAHINNTRYTIKKYYDVYFSIYIGKRIYSKSLGNKKFKIEKYKIRKMKVKVPYPDRIRKKYPLDKRMVIFYKGDTNISKYIKK